MLDQGIDVLQHDPHRLDDIATRMVDLGLSGMARKLRSMPEKTEDENDWQVAVLRNWVNVTWHVALPEKTIFRLTHHYRI